MKRNADPTFRNCGSILVGTTLMLLCSATVQSAPQSLTQSTNPNVLETTSVACATGGITTDTYWWRLFDLDVQFDLVGDFCTKDVDYGIESSEGLQNLTVNVHCLDDGLPFMNEFLTLAGTATQNQPDAVQEFFNIEVAGCCNTADQSMAIELVSDDCVELGTCADLFIGTNSLGETYSTYISAPDCGIDEPFPTEGLVGFFVFHLVMVVNGNDDLPCGNGVLDLGEECDDGNDVSCDGCSSDCVIEEGYVCGDGIINEACGEECDDGNNVDGDGCDSDCTSEGDDGGEVPASSGIGVMILVLLLLGTGAYALLRRRRSGA